MREFGRRVLIHTGSATEETERKVRENYARTKDRHFPDWPGEPEWIWNTPAHSILGVTVYCASGWICDVPDEYVTPHLSETDPDTPVYNALIDHLYPLVVVP